MTVVRSEPLGYALATVAERLRGGQAHEAHNELTLAVGCYDDVIAVLRRWPLEDVETRRMLGVAWMNRGNALQKLARSRPEEPAVRSDAVRSYDEAILLLAALPSGVAEFRNHLGAAWLNRGHAWLGFDPVEAGRSFEKAIDALAELPLGENLSYRLNLAGAWTNLAHVQLPATPERAHASAAAALLLVGDSAAHELSVAEMNLRARRARVMALGQLLHARETAGQPVGTLAAEARDALDDGLAITREWEQRGVKHLRPLALRLFRLGAQVYQRYQPHFLAEFLLENVAPGAFIDDPEFHAAAEESLTQALAELQRPRLLIADTPAAAQLLVTAQSLRAARDELSLRRAYLSTAPNR